MTSDFELHVLASGSDGNCSVIKANGTALMVDAGLSGRKIERLLDRTGLGPADISAVLLTHEHSDHVRGAGVLARRHGMPVYGNRNTLESSKLGFGVNREVFKTNEQFQFGPLSVLPLPVSHNAAEPNAFSFTLSGHSCLVASDLGTVNLTILSEMERADLVMVEANHDMEMLINGPYPPFLKRIIRGEKGHLSNADCGRALKATAREGRSVFLSHLSKNNNTPQIARETVARYLSCSTDSILCLEEPGVPKVMGIE